MDYYHRHKISCKKWYDNHKEQHKAYSQVYKYYNQDAIREYQDNYREKQYNYKNNIQTCDKCGFQILGKFMDKHQKNPLCEYIFKYKRT